ncbi:MAG: ABC transporter ATP-binding protein [Microgenomates group bacterium]
MIVLSSVFKFFGEKKVIDDLNFKIKEGEIVGFLGRNGAGKTTTMRLILGYLRPSKGEIFIDDLNPIKNRVEVLQKIGYLPENNPLYQEMQVKEYLQFIAAIKKEKEWEKIAVQVGLNEVLKQKIEELSRGFRQRVGLAAAIMGDPKILILDEPTSGLDPIEQEKIKTLIKKISKNKIIIFSTHILSEVEDVANRLIIIDQGKIVYDGKKPKERIEKLFKKVVKE